jgi:hypothetical protein
MAACAGGSHSSSSGGHGGGGGNAILLLVLLASSSSLLVHLVGVVLPLFVAHCSFHKRACARSEPSNHTIVHPMTGHVTILTQTCCRVRTQQAVMASHADAVF